MIGNIIDIKIEEGTGQISSFVVEINKMFIKVFGSKEEYDVKWSQITKIGEDVILIKIDNN